MTTWDQAFKRRTDIKDLAYFQTQIGVLLWRWETLSMSSLSILFASLMQPAGFLSEFSLPARIAINFGLTAFFWTCNFTLLPWVLWRGLRLNLPWVPVQMGLYVVLSLISAVFLEWVTMRPMQPLNVATTFAIITVPVAIGFLIFVQAVKHTITEVFAQDPQYFPLWQPAPINSCGLQSLLQPALRGRVRRISVESQYLRIFTDQGQSVIRCSLGKATGLLPQESGIRIHRSHWLACEDIDNLHFDNGNPRITDSFGDILPVSRSTVDAIRGKLS
ncbi:MAG: hypothetical protein COB16_11085 [Rhodobacteraceae bacterium]|nr:MAG: hypothetical protein COB16_11085 [Paracoccaceae bacterium]